MKILYGIAVLLLLIPIPKGSLELTFLDVDRETVPVYKQRQEPAIS